MDRRLVGILLIAVIASTSLSVVLLIHPSEESIRLLKDRWETTTIDGWQQLPVAERSISYTIGLVARKPLAEVSVRFGVLRNRTLSVDYSGWENLTPKEKAVTVGRLKFLETRAADLANLSTVPEEVWADVTLGEQKSTLLLIDYDPLIAPLVDRRICMDVPSLFGFVFEPSGNISSFYSGYWDFFVDRGTSLLDMAIQLNEEVTRFANDQNMVAGCIPIDTTVSMAGRVVFTDLKKDDRIFITYRINGGAVTGDASVMQVVKIEVDGRHVDTRVNVLKR